MKLVVNEAINKSMVVGLGRGITQLNFLSFLEEKLMLNQKKCQSTSPQGVNLQFGYYYTWNFVINGAQKSKRVNNMDLSLHKDGFGPFLRQCVLYSNKDLLFWVLNFFCFLGRCLDFFSFFFFWVGTNKASKKTGSLMFIIVMWNTISQQLIETLQT
jgi:hypothetical protein